jgi:hypothetical protein
MEPALHSASELHEAQMFPLAQICPGAQHLPLQQGATTPVSRGHRTPQAPQFEES